MAKVAAWHSTEPGSTVYHNNDKCVDGNNIEKKYWTSGTGTGRTLCTRCKELNDQGK